MKIAIQGHPTRGEEVIKILESLGGLNSISLSGTNSNRYYFIYDNNVIMNVFYNANYKIYTLEEFEKEFPFKIGDKVSIAGVGHSIIALEYFNDKLCYKLDNRLLYSSKTLKFYNEMKEERNVTLTLDKAKEWYKKGGELKEIALQAFTEKELNPLPKSWEEFCEKYPIKAGECILEAKDRITVAPCNFADMVFKNWIPSKKSAEAHLAMIQLEQLRNCWWGDWEPKWNNCEKYVIKWDNDDLIVFTARNIRAFLAFPTREMAEEFLKCFRDLIEKTGDLI